MASRRALVRLLPVLLLVLLAAPLAAQNPGLPGGGSGPLCPACWGVSVTPDGTGMSVAQNSSGNVAEFVVNNTGTAATTFTLTCKALKFSTCSVDQSSVYLAGGSGTDVEVTFSAGVFAGSLSLIASGAATDTGYYSVSLLPPPTISILSPVVTSGSRAVVHTRQPLFLATIVPVSGATIDSTKTVLTWKGDTVTSLARQNRGVVEWELDSIHRLAVGDSGLLSLRSCTTQNACGTTTRWAVLVNDSTPVLGFTGMPLEAVNGGFASSFGPGVGVVGAEVTTGFSTIPYFSMGSARGTGLVYSTRTSYPRALVNVDLELPWPAGTPSQIKLILKDGVTGLDSVTLSSPTCATGAVKKCRATLQGDFSGSTFSSPTGKWLTVEARVTSGATTKISADSVEIVLVDRRTTAYGSGWWPSGVSQLVAAGNDRILVGSGGTATIFRGNGDSLYLSPPGSFTTLVKTANGWELRPRGSTAKVKYDSQGRLAATVDANGNRDTVTYTGSGAVSVLKDPKDKTITFAYDGNGKISTITALTSGAARATKVVVNGTTYQLTYDSLSSLPARPFTTKYTYQTYPGTGTVVLTRRIGVITDTTTIVYDSTFKRRPIQAKAPRVQDETGTWLNPTVTYMPYERQGWGSLRSLDSVYVEMEDPKSNWTRSLINRWAQALKSWDALGTLSEAQYDADGFLLWSQGKTADSSRTYAAYDAFKRVVKTYIIRAAGDTLRGDSLVYDGNHRVVKRIDNRNKVDSLDYDANGNLIYAKDAQGNVTLTWYKSNGQVDSVRLPGSSKSRHMTYETTWGNPWQTIDESGQVVSQVLYDIMGRDTTNDSKIPVKSTGTAVKYQWRRGRQVYTTANEVTTSMSLRTDDCTAPCNTPSWPLTTDTLRVQHVGFVKDRAGRDSLRLTIHTTDTTATMYVYDRLSRLLSRRPWTDSMAVKDSMVYDKAGNLKKSITRRGYTIETWYDSRNRDTLTTIPTVGDRKTKYTGPLDQVTRIWWASQVDSIGKVLGAVAWTYDQRGRLKTDTTKSGSIARPTSYTYDTWERPATVTDALGTWTTKYETLRGMADSLLTPWADTVSYAFDGRGRPAVVRIASPSGAAHTNLSYALTGELDERHTTISGYTLGRYERASDPTGPDTMPGPALSNLWTGRNNASGLDSLQDSTVYDGWRRVISWVQHQNSSHFPVDSLTFSFDKNGNIRTPGGTEFYHTVTSRLLQRKTSGYTHWFTYDRDGNLTKDSSVVEVRTYDYDALNRLRSVRRNGTLIVRYGYDVLGRRIAKRVYSSATGGTVGYTRYVYHGDHVAFETDSAGSTIGWRYTWGLGTDDLLALRDAAGNHYYTAQDKLGSVRTLTQRNGTWKYAVSYDPYGNQETQSGTDPGLRYRWTGREYDAETGWYFHRARYYSPDMLRFVQEDPIGYGGGANVYSYVGGQVLDARDPSGMNMDYESGWTANCGNLFCMNRDGTIGGSGQGSLGERLGGALTTWADLNEAALDAWAEHKAERRQEREEQEKANASDPEPYIFSPGERIILSAYYNRLTRGEDEYKEWTENVVYRTIIRGRAIFGLVPHYNSVSIGPTFFQLRIDPNQGHYPSNPYRTARGALRYSGVMINQGNLYSITAAVNTRVGTVTIRVGELLEGGHDIPEGS